MTMAPMVEYAIAPQTAVETLPHCTVAIAGIPTMNDTIPPPSIVYAPTCNPGTRVVSGCTITENSAQLMADANTSALPNKLSLPPVTPAVPSTTQETPSNWR